MNGSTLTEADYENYFGLLFHPMRYGLFYEILPDHVTDKNFKNLSRAGSRIERSTA